MHKTTILHWTFICIFYGFFAAKAFIEFQPTSDFIWYHLPRALAYFELTSFTPEPRLLKLYMSYPPLGDYLEGLLIFTTGRISTANAIGIVGILLSILCLWTLFRREELIRWLLTFLIAVPAYVLHLPIGYLDLFCGCMLLIAFAGIVSINLEKKIFCSSSFVILGIGAAMFTKMSVWPACLVLMLAGLWCFLRLQIPMIRKSILIILLIVCAGLYPIRNFVLFGNPLYPVKSGLWKNAEGFVTYPVMIHIPPYLQRAPTVKRFIHSALEINRMRSNEPYLWTYNEYFSPYSDHQRMGGWFFATVILISALLLYGGIFRKIPGKLLFIFVALLLITAVTPHSNYLRYWLYIPMISIFLITFFLEQFSKVVRLIAKIGFCLCALYVLTALDAKTFTIDKRLPQEYAPKEAREFWAAHPNETTPLEIERKGEASIYWSGPTFSEIPVRVK